MEMPEEYFNALGQYFLDSMQIRLDHFRAGYEGDSDFANSEEESDVLREVGRCLGELIILNTVVIT